VTTIAADVIKELAAFRSGTAPVVTIYLDVDGRRHARPLDYELELDHLVREALDRPGGAAASDDLQRISDHVRAGLDRTRVRGLAMFSCVAEGLWRVIELPVSVQDRVVVNAAPALAQLESVAQESARVGVLAVDKQRARVFVFELGELLHSDGLTDELARDIDHLGNKDQGDPSHHVDELVANHLRNAARQAFDVFQHTGVRDVLLAVPDQLLNALERGLHPYVAERVRGRLHVRIDGPLDELRESVLAMEHEITVAREDQMVAQLRAAVGTGNKGVSGLAETLAALADRRVDLLLVSAGFSTSGWHCSGCGCMASVGRRCGRCEGEMDAVDDIVEDAIDVALAQGCRVEIVSESADLDVLGRIGAVLRF